MRTNASTVLDKIISRLIHGLQPEKIYLFGSQSREEARPDSDYDLLVIVPNSNEPRYKREAHSYDLLWGITTPVDVIVLTRAEFQQTCQVSTSLAATVQKEGKLLYG